MTSAGIYNLLITDDTQQDSYLIAQKALDKRLQQIKQNKLNDLINTINILKSNLKAKNTNLKKIINTKLYQQTLEDINKLETEIVFYENNKDELIKPNINNINESHFLFINNQYKPFVEFSFSYIKSIVNTSPNFGDQIEFNIQDYGDFISDMLLYIRISELKALEEGDKVRYADYIGHKIINNAQFVISNNILDEYDSELYNIHYNLHISEAKKNSWLKCIGQEIGINASLTQDPVNDNYTEEKIIHNGFQTLKPEHPKLEMFIPMLFWFNKDIRLAFPNHIKPVGQIKVKIKLEELNKLMTCLDIQNDKYNEKFLIPSIEECVLYTRHIYINKEIQDIFISKLGFNLIRINKKIEKVLNINNDRVLLQELKFPIESLYTYFRPVSNEEGLDSFETWHLNSALSLKYIKTPVIYKVAGVDTLGINNIKYYEQKPIVNSLNFETNDSSTYGTQSINFYDGYLPYISSPNIKSTTNNIYYMPFTMLPLENQPCGYLNLSKSREIYLEYSSDIIEDNSPIKLYMYATALNFLIISQNSATLKYLT